MTRIDISGTYNFRPVAGTREGTLFRSDALARVNRAGRASLRNLDIRRIFDLRSDLDRRLGGRDRIRGVGAELISAPMMSGTKKSDVHSLTLDGVYRDLLDQNARTFGHVIRSAVDAPTGAVVIHCTAGKDRTGLSSALIQLALGLDEDRVVADYAMTQANLEGDWAERMSRKLRRFRVEITPALEEILVGSPPRAMIDALDHLRRHHGGVDAYLDTIGVTDDVRQRLHSRFGA